MQIDTAAYQRVLGDELRSLRKQRGWTRKELNRRLQSDISLQTLATYELGTRQCSVVRLVEICVALGVPAHEVLARVHERVFGDAPAGHLSVDLATVVADPRPQTDAPAALGAGQARAPGARPAARGAPRPARVGVHGPVVPAQHGGPDPDPAGTGPPAPPVASGDLPPLTDPGSRFAEHSRCRPSPPAAAHRGGRATGQHEFQAVAEDGPGRGRHDRRPGRAEARPAGAGALDVRSPGRAGDRHQRQDHHHDDAQPGRVVRWARSPPTTAARTCPTGT